MRKTSYLFSLLVLVLFCANAQEVPFSPRLSDNGNTYINLRGNYTFLSNSVMNRIEPYSNGNLVNTPYDGGASNNNLHVEYVDVDNDPSTFSSSSSTLSLPTCSRIEWAGLYWAGNYDVERGYRDPLNYFNANFPSDSTRNDFTSIRLRPPGGTYIDIQADNDPDPAGEEDNIIIDGFNSVPNSPYVCYKNVTTILQALADPNGEYFVANVRGTKGHTTYGAAGWTLVVIYENPTLTGKYISVFDGYEGITTDPSNSSADITVSGFNTIPAGQVIARIGVASMEGETSLPGDTFGIISNSSAAFTDITNAANPSDNFFNSSITVDGVHNTNRNLNSINAIGYDSDIFNLDNPGNSIIDNGDSSATLRLGTSRDWFASFLVTFGIEVIEPNIVLEKRVQDIAGNDITGLGVNLGQILDYILTFENIGNDDATEYTIRDVLPINVTLDTDYLDNNLLPGVTYVYDATTRTVTFTVPDNLVEEEDTEYSIRMRVQVAENCTDFVDACTNQIQNLAYSTYRGVTNTNQISDDPSVASFDICGFVVPGATNFLLDDLASCDFSRTVLLCGDDVLLEAGDNFDVYTWYLDVDADGIIDPEDVLLNDGDPDGNPSTFLATNTGIYIVDKDVADPCIDSQEVITVELFGVTQTNPITALINDPTNTVEGDILVCTNDGEELPQIFLCGQNDTENISINIPDAISIDWQQMDETTCAGAISGCIDNSCSWNTIGTGNSFAASDAGEFRVQINYQNGCRSVFYFNVFQNPLNPQYNSSDIICNTPGNITVTNMPLDYEYQLVDETNDDVLVPYTPNPSFDIATNGAYRIEMRQQGVVNGCVFVLENIGILDRDFQVIIDPIDATCSGFGEITISALNVSPQYYFEILQGTTPISTYGPSSDNNHTFENLVPGTYDVRVTTDDGCIHNEQVTIADFSDLDLSARVSQHITCREGNIQMDSSGGLTPHTYAIWSFVDESGTTQISYPSISDVPASAFQTSVIFDILIPGDYTFLVVDRNNCNAISNTVTIILQPSVEYNTAFSDESCFGANDGSIDISLTDSNGYQVAYYLIDESGNEIASNSSGLFLGLGQGDYSVRINQRRGSRECDFFENFTISGPLDNVSGDLAIIQDYTCLQDGAIQAQNVVGGTAPYEYSLDGVNFVSGTGAETFTNLTDGTYTVTIRDANNCPFETAPITIPPLNPPTDLTFLATPANCPSETSDITVTAVGGEVPMVFEIIAPSSVAASSTSGNSASFNNLSPDTYTFRVIDANGCQYTEDFTIDPVNRIGVTGQLLQNISCINDMNGAALFSVTDFNTTYDYVVTGPATFSGTNETNTTINLAGLDDGTYSIVVTDNQTNCTANTTVVIDSPAAALTLSLTETQPTCTTDGSIQLMAPGGWGGNSFEIIYPDGVTGFTNSTGAFSGLNQNTTTHPAGMYTVSVTDTNGCMVSDTFVLNAALPPVLQLTPNNICYDNATGLTLTAAVLSGGDGNFEYSLNGGGFGINPVFNGLGPGTYTVDVRDGNNCTDSASITIHPELDLSASAPNITSCGTDTAITITAAGGDGNFVYAVVSDGVTPTSGDFSTTNPVTVTAAGDYDVYVRDNAGGTGFCEANFDIGIVQDAPLGVAATPTHITCFGENDGAISLLASGGQGPYEYSIDNGANYQIGEDFNNLVAGTYNIRIRDALACEATTTITLNEPAQLVAESVLTQNYSCLQTGEITVGGVTPTSGGSGNYQYSLNGGPWSASTTGGITFTGLINGTYSVQVRDAYAPLCSLPLPNITIDPLPVEPAIDPSLTYNCDGSGNITILPIDPTYTYSLDGGAFQTSNVFNSIAPGNHSVTINYGSDCLVSGNVFVENGRAFEANITTFSNISCHSGTDGSITFSVANFGAGGFEYSLDGFTTILGTSTSSPITINTLTAGNYNISVRDVNDPVAACTVLLNQSLSEPAQLNLSHTLTQPTCVADGSIVINASGGSGGFTYQIEQPDGTILGPQTSSIFNALSQIGLHTITVTDANACVETDTFTTVTPVNPTIGIDASSNFCFSAATGATIVLTATAGVAPYFYRINGGPLQNSNTFSGLIPDTYTFSITDSLGCTDDVMVTVEPELTPNLVLTKDIDCSASPDAILTLNVNGGYAPYSYEIAINGGAYASYTGAMPYTTLSPGTYQFRVTDNQGCVAETNTVMVTAPVNPVATTAVTEPACTGDSNGIVEIIVDPNFGIAPYEYSFDGSAFSPQTVYPGLAAGTFAYSVRDANGCLFNNTVTLTDPALFTANVTPFDVSCGGVGVGDIPGRIEIDIPATSGGVPNFTYTLYDRLNTIVPTLGPNPIVNTSSTNITFDGLAFGDYYVRIIDANGCEYYENPVRVLANPFLTVNSTVVADCATGGTVSLSSSGGSGNYDFTIYNTAIGPATEVSGPGATEETATFTGLNTGQTYIFQVIDALTGCSSFVEETIPTLSSIDVVPNPTVNDVTCNGDTNGSIAFQIQDYHGSVTDINYEIRESLTNDPLGAAYSGTATGPTGPGPTGLVTVSNIPPGDYVLYFEEATSPFCSNTFNFRILEPNPVAVTLIDQNNGNCNEDANITVLGSGGTGPYTYAYVQDGVIPTVGDYVTNNYVELDPALNTDWDVHVLDADGCPGPVLDITLVEDPEPIISAVVTNQCAVPEGSFIIEITLDAIGVGPYDVSVNGGAYQSTTLINLGDTFQYTGLSSGPYTFSVRDANACGNMVAVNVLPPTSLSASVTTQPSCLGGDGVIEITPFGGSGNYLYEVFDSASNSVTGGPQASPIFTGLNVDSYTAFIYDQVLTGCDASIMVATEIPQAVAFTTSPTEVSCFGDADGTITVTLDPLMNNPPYTYQLFDSSGTVPITGIQTSNIFTGLVANPYVVRVYSGRACFDNVPETVGGPDAITNVNASVVEFECNTGNNPINAAITIDDTLITGGSGTYVTYEFINDQGTAILTDDIVVQSSNSPVYTETDVTGGTYIINVYDNNGCIGSTTANILPYDELISATASVTNPLSCNPGADGEITISVTSTLGDATRFEYSIDNGTTWQNTGTHTNPELFMGLGSGTHNFLVRHIDTGCLISTSESIAAPDVLQLSVTGVSGIVCYGSSTGSANLELQDAAGIIFANDVDYLLYHDVNNTPTNLADDVVTMGGETSGAINLNSLASGSYIIDVTEANFPNCTYRQTFAVASPDASIMGNTAVVDISCAPGNNDGVIEVINVTGGWGNYQYYVSTTPIPDEFDSTNYVTNPKFENLVAGNYQIWVIDQNGCPERLTDVPLSNPTPILADLQINNDNCINLEGEIEVVGIPATSSISGGQGSNYSYQLIRNGTNVGSPQTNPVFSNLGAGSYEVYILDQWACDVTVGPVVLNDAMTATANVLKPIDCTADPGGHITINVSGGSLNLDYQVTYPISGTTISNSTGVFTNLTEVGEYIFLVTDLDTATPCTVEVRQILDAPSAVTFNTPTRVNVSCFGGNDGAVTVNLLPQLAGVNDNLPYTYVLYDNGGGVLAGPQNNPTFTGLTTGNYRIEAISNRGCANDMPVFIAEPNPLVVTASATAFGCNTNNQVDQASLTITAVDGTGPYLYSIDNINFQTSSSFAVLDNGANQNITVYVEDANGCLATDSITIETINTFTATVAQDVAISCANDEQLTITVTENSPGDSYTFELLPVGNSAGTMVSNTATTATFDISSTGSYTFRVTNTTTGCYVTTGSYTVAPFDLIEATATAIAPSICYGDNNGALEINIAGYTGNYRYQIYEQGGTPFGAAVDTDTSVNPRTINGLSGSNYYVNISQLDAPFCFDNTNVVTIDSPQNLLDANPTQIASVQCTNDQGEIEVQPTGGMAPYQILLRNTTTSQDYTIANVTSHVFTGLSAGNFDVQITDMAGCTINRSVNVAQPLPITANISATPTTLACYGDTNASVSAINVLNGEGVYQYQLNTYDATGAIIAFTSGAQNSPVFNNLGAGIYSITVSDGWSCGVETPQVTISEPVEVFASLIQLSPLSCSTNAEIELQAIGGTAPYEYSSDGTNYLPMGAGDSDRFSVVDGRYQYYVRDSRGCEAMVSNEITIAEIAPLTIEIDESAAVINCAGEASATIVANVTGGLGDYSYELYTDAAMTNLYAGPQTTNTFSGLPAGEYFVRVISEDCEAVEAVTPIVDPAPLQIDRNEFTDVSCAGEEDGTITVEVSGGTGEIWYAITPNLNQFDQENVFTDLAPGTYDVIAQDENGCFIPFQFEIEAPEPLEVEISEISHEVCIGENDGAVEIEITGGTAPYRTGLNTSTDANMVEGQTRFENMAPETYVIFVKDAQDCETRIFVEIEPGVSLEATVEPIYECIDNSTQNRILVTLNDQSLSSDVLYGMDTTDTNDMHLAPDFSNLSPGAHSLSIVHANGCVNTIDFEIDGFEPLTLALEQNNINEITAVVTGGSPEYTFVFDGDNNGNDNTYRINRTDTFTVTVIDQLGCELSAEIEMEFIDVDIPDFFTPDGDGRNDFWIPENIEAYPDILIQIYDRYGRVVANISEGHTGWDGNYQGYPLPTGDYWFIVRLNGENDEREFVGHFTLYR